MVARVPALQILAMQVLTAIQVFEVDAAQSALPRCLESWWVAALPISVSLRLKLCVSELLARELRLTFLVGLRVMFIPAEAIGVKALSLVNG